MGELIGGIYFSVGVIAALVSAACALWYQYDEEENGFVDTCLWIIASVWMGVVGGFVWPIIFIAGPIWLIRRKK